MDPLVAKGLKEQGFETKQQVVQWLSKNFKMPAGQFWGSDLIYSLMGPMAREGVEPYATWAKLPKDELIAAYDHPESMNIVVVGGETNSIWFTTDMTYTQSQSIDKWRPRSGKYEEDTVAARRRAARQKRHAEALNYSGYDVKK